MGTTKATLRTAGSVILDWVEESMMLDQLGKVNAARAHSLRAHYTRIHYARIRNVGIMWAFVTRLCRVCAWLRCERRVAALLCQGKPRSRRAAIVQ